MRIIIDIKDSAFLSRIEKLSNVLDGLVTGTTIPQKPGFSDTIE